MDIEAITARIISQDESSIVNFKRDFTKQHIVNRTVMKLTALAL